MLCTWVIRLVRVRYNVALARFYASRVIMPRHWAALRVVWRCIASRMNLMKQVGLSTKLGLRFWQAWVLSEQSAVFLDEGKYDQAERTCSESIAIFREQKALRGEGWALRVLGDIARKRRNTLDARDYYHQSLALFNMVGDRVDQAHVLNSLGANILAEGNILEAKERFEHARAVAHDQNALQLE